MNVGVGTVDAVTGSQITWHAMCATGCDPYVMNTTRKMNRGNVWRSRALGDSFSGAPAVQCSAVQCDDRGLAIHVGFREQTGVLRSNEGCDDDAACGCVREKPYSVLRKHCIVPPKGLKLQKPSDFPKTEPNT